LSAIWPIDSAELFAEHKFNAVLHFAASISVPDSVVKPLEYYSNNTANTLNLLHCCQQFDVNKLIFSSTAAVYGQPEVNPITEETSPQPLNPYGSSKLMSERLIRDYAVASNLKYVILRYFNVAGAEIGGSLGQTGKKASHLLKVACDAALGQRSHVGIFGTDFDTPDGTGIRDYIHVDDLARAHVDALIYLNGDHPSQILNCGYGQGYSVREVIEKVKEISGVDFTVIEAERRAGDPACVIAANDRITKVLGWKPRFNDLDTIVRTALDWEKKLAANSQPIKELVG
jgi:UDP-glucose 4-epimerase